MERRRNGAMSLQVVIADALASTPSDRPVWVALSGGLDSSVLLTLAAQAAYSNPRPLYALHIDHGLQPAAVDFERHCRILCSRLGVALFTERVSVERMGQGLEAAARDARYAAFARRVAPGDTLWLAQHGDDQAETLLLAALRGSGVRGLAGMPVTRDWRERHVARPLLGISRQRLAHEAASRDIRWCDDPSNDDTALDRNFLRHAVLPLLTQRWPEASASLARVAQRAAEADGLLDELAALDLASAANESGRLDVHPVQRLSRPRQRLLVRHACQRLDLPTPPAARLDTLLDQLTARADAGVHVTWPGGEARRWRGCLYLQAPAIEAPGDWHGEWDGRPGLVTPVGRIDWRLSAINGGAIALRLTLRRGGETLCVTGRGRRDVKRLLQEADVPPWQRPRQLLAWQGETLVAVLGIAVADGWRQRHEPPD